MADDDIRKMTFEQAIGELEKVVNRLDQGDVPLEEFDHALRAGREAEGPLRRQAARGGGEGRADHPRRQGQAYRDPARRGHVSLPERLRTAQDDIAATLAARLAAHEGPVGDAMRYAAAGGKRLRGFLLVETAALFDVPRAAALPAAAAIEAVHAYSLVHDDLPCMDDDDLRRGQPTVHRRWDEATAVLAGDALQTAAFEWLAGLDADPAIRCDLVLTLAQAAGASGMVRGQALDIAAETAAAPLTLDAITDLQRHKTGRLLEWPCRAGALLGHADPAPLLTYAADLGLAFQIADDLLDVEGDAGVMGKAARKDAAAGKATFVSLLGVAGARRRAEELVASAQDALLPFGPRAAILSDVARYVVTRDK